MGIFTFDIFIFILRYLEVLSTKKETKSAFLILEDLGFHFDLISWFVHYNKFGVL